MTSIGGVASQTKVNINPKAEDCYYYYYSKCSKGDNCFFRHCSAALGNEDVCELWKNGDCTRPVCAFKHSSTNRQRSAIPCYWENQPNGCLKAHCPFKHFKPRLSSVSLQQRITECQSMAALEKVNAVKIKSLNELKAEKSKEISSKPSSTSEMSFKLSDVIPPVYSEDNKQSFVVSSDTISSRKYMKVSVDLEHTPEIHSQVVNDLHGNDTMKKEFSFRVSPVKAIGDESQTLEESQPIKRKKKIVLVRKRPLSVSTSTTITPSSSSTSVTIATSSTIISHSASTTVSLSSTYTPLTLTPSSSSSSSSINSFISRTVSSNSLSHPTSTIIHPSSYPITPSSSSSALPTPKATTDTCDSETVPCSKKLKTDNPGADDANSMLEEKKEDTMKNIAVMRAEIQSELEKVEKERQASMLNFDLEDESIKELIGFHGDDHSESYDHLEESHNDDDLILELEELIN